MRVQVEELDHLKLLMDAFALASGLKSTIASQMSAPSTPNLDDGMSILAHACKKGAMTFRYLGIPLCLAKLKIVHAYKQFKED